MTIDGDLGRVVAGDADLRTPGLAALRVASLGDQGTATQPPGGTLETDVRGPLGRLYVRGDVVNVSVFAHGNPVNVGDRFGTIGKVFVGGDLVGGGADNSGSIFASGAIGPVHIGGAIMGGDGSGSGSVASLSFSRGIGSVYVGEGFVGGGGDGSGGINSNGPIASVLIGGSIMGGTAQSSGRLHAGGTLGPVQVQGDVVGGTGPNSAAIHGSSKVTSVFIGGDVIGGVGFASASLSSAAGYGSLEIVGDLRGGNGEESGRLFVGGRLGRLFVGGDLRTGTGTKSGTVEVGDDVSAIEVLGSVVGTAANPVTITARGMPRPGLTRDLAIGVLSVGGSVEFARILAGYDFSLRPTNADASIGTVEVDGDWVASDLVAGAVAGADGLFGTSDDARIRRGSPRRLARIVSIAVGGTVQGTLAPLDHFGMVAELVGSLTVNGAAVALTPEAHNDDVALGATGDVRLREL